MLKIGLITVITYYHRKLQSIQKEIIDVNAEQRRIHYEATMFTTASFSDQLKIQFSTLGKYYKYSKLFD